MDCFDISLVNCLSDNYDLDNIEIELCCKKDCFDIKYDRYFCIDHTTEIEDYYKPTEKTKALHFDTKQCAAKRCKRNVTIESNLCFEHKTSINHIKPRLEFKCKNNDCGSVKEWRSNYCIVHM